MSQVTDLLNSLPKSPAMRIIHITNSNKLCSEIQNFSKDTDNSNEYLILTLKQELETSLKSLENSYTKVKYLDTNRPKYNIQAKLYDYLFIEALANDRESFFKKCYSTLKNAAPIFIFLNREQKELSYKIESELIECNYVATNKMEIDDFLVISAKKMHGWSGV